MIKYEVKAVVCDYGIFESGKLKLVVNSQANALLIKYVLEEDLKHNVVIKELLKKKSHKKRKFKAMTVQDFCDRNRCNACGYAEPDGGIYCFAEDYEKDKACKTVTGKYILREVKK